MDIKEGLKKNPEENEEQYIWRIGTLIDSGKLPQWAEIVDVINKELGYDEDKWKHESTFRKKYQASKLFYDNVFSKMESEDFYEDVKEARRSLEREKVKFRDERNEWNKQNRIEARVESKLDLLEDALREIGEKKYEPTRVNENIGYSDCSLLVPLTDLHIGATFSSTFGEYNSDVARERMKEYANHVIKIHKDTGAKKCYISCQGDLISGSIHKSIAITNRENVIEQVKIATELITDFCIDMTQYFDEVYFQDVTGNHTRIDRKEDALHDERLDDLIGFNIENIMAHVPNFHYLTNKIDSGIGVLDICGNKYIQVHGDFDSFSMNGVARLVLMLGFKPYAVLYGHMHTNAFDDVNGVKIVRSGSLSGAGDSYTIEKRLCGSASQMVAVCDESGIRSFHPIEFR